MTYRPETPFDNVESAQQFLDLLAEAIQEAKQEVDADMLLVAGSEEERRRQALQLVSYNLAKLSMHITTSRRILNDLRTLRRLLLNERSIEAETPSGASAS